MKINKMNKTGLVLVMMLLSFSVFAQKEHFRILNAKDGKPVFGVKVKSLHEHDLIAFSNDSGYFDIKVKHDDTLTITKDYFHPIYVVVRMNNFDSLHTIVLSLVPSANKSNAVLSDNFSSLSNFEYHFTHDQLGDDSHVNVTIYEPKEAVQTRQQWKDNSFHLGAISLEPVHVKHKQNVNPNYIPKK